MITPTIFWVLAGIDVALIVYSFWDHENRFYGNIITSLVSWVLAAILGLYVLNGSVGETTPMVATKLVNWTGPGTNYTTTFSYVNQTVTMQNIALGYGFSLAAVGMFIFMLLFIVEARTELAGEEKE